MSTEDGWLLRPVHRQMIRMADLLDGSIGLAEVDWANEYLDVYDENTHRIQEAMKET